MQEIFSRSKILSTIKTLVFSKSRCLPITARAPAITHGCTVALLVRDQQGAIVAGLSGWTWGGMLKIQYLWVREDHRGQGYGRRKCRPPRPRAGRAAAARWRWDMHSFQAPDFYPKFGYALMVCWKMTRLAIKPIT